MKWAHEQALPDSESKLLLLILANYAGHDNTCWPSVNSLASECVFSESTARRRLQELEKMGLINIIPRKDSHGDPTSNLYRLLTGPPVRLTPPPCQADTRGGVPLTPKPISTNQSINLGRGTTRSIMDLKDIMGAKQSIADGIRNKWSAEVADGRHWRDEKHRQEYHKLKAEIRALNEQIASM